MPSERINMFFDLTRDYFDRTSAKKARAILLRAKNKRKLSHLLRHHEEREITDAETWDRDAVDNLLSYYAVIEVGLCAQAVSQHLPSPFVAAAALDLSDPDLK